MLIRINIIYQNIKRKDKLIIIVILKFKCIKLGSNY